MRTLGLVSLGAVLVAAAVACGSSDGESDSGGGGTGGKSGSGGNDSGVGATSGGGGAGGGTAGSGGTTATPGKVDIVRDSRGVPHLYGENLEAAVYGLGYVHAEDRLFQMDFSRRWMQGRLAEWFGRGAADSILNKDKYQRVLGFHAHALEIASQLPDDVKKLLEAYVKGVNDFVARSEFVLPPAYAEVGATSFEPWTVADTLLAWDRLTQVFNGDGSDSELSALAQCRKPEGCISVCGEVIDEDAAHVPNQLQASVSPHDFGLREVNMKASHAWVVSGAHTTTGLPVLHSDPQTGVRAPSVWTEFHVSAPGVDARGIGAAGTPAFLIFWNRHIAQGLTAAGGDITDLYELTLSADGSKYVVDGVEKDFVESKETIAIKGESPVDIVRRESQFGPVVNDVLTEPTGPATYAERHVNIWKDDDHSLVGAIRMFQAKNLDEYRDALEHWQGPGANAIYADADGHIAYHPLVWMPTRAVHDKYPGFEGRVPSNGSTAANDWGAVLGKNDRPHTIDPSAGYILSGNHLVVGKWYSKYTGLGGNGDTDRSLRLRYLLASKLHKAPGKPWDPVDPAAKMTPDEVFAIHKDSGSDVVRLYRLALGMLQKKGLVPAGSDAEKVLTGLNAWKDSFVASDPVTLLAEKTGGTLPGKFRKQIYPGIACKWGGSYGGLSHFLKAVEKGETDPAADPEAVKYLIDMAGLIWAGTGKPGAPSSWPPFAPTFGVQYQANFFCKTDANKTCELSENGFDVKLDVNFIGSILSQQGNSYSQSVNFADLETSKAVLPPGVSEDPSSTLFSNNLELWKKGDLAPSPMERGLVDQGALSTTTLDYKP